MRIDTIVKNEEEMTKNFKLSTEEGRQLATISVMTDISETLAIICDLYAMVHGKEVSPNGERNANKQQ